MTIQLLAEIDILKEQLERYDKLWDELPNKIYHILLDNGPEDRQYTALEIRNILMRRF